MCDLNIVIMTSVRRRFDLCKKFLLPSGGRVEFY
jgi:hypothetical protein